MPMRYDRLQLKARRDDNDFIHDTPVLTRTGVFIYRMPNGEIRREYRPAEEVFKVDSLTSYKGIPITDEHHGEIRGNNSKGLIIGTVTSEGKQDGNNLIADIVIHNTEPVMFGKKELSVGYKVDIEEKSGITEDGEKYDVIQRNIRPNHLAVVSRGRAGNARLNLDSADAVEYEKREDENMDKLEKMTEIRLDSGISYKAEQEVAVAFNKLKQDVADVVAQKDKETARADAAEAKVKELESKQEKIRQDSFIAAKTRIELEQIAKNHNVEVKADSTDRALQEAVITAIRGDSDLTDKSDAYIQAAFDLALKDNKTRQDNAQLQYAQFNQSTQMTQDSTEKLTGRAAMLASRNQ